MKKITLLILAAVALCSCSKDETAIAPANGQYIYENENLTVAVQINNAETGIIIFESSAYVYQSLRQTVSGSWPTYRYEYGHGYNELVLDCQYAENTVFVANVSDNQTEINLPTTMQFRLDNRTLDANGDGVLDSWQ